MTIFFSLGCVKRKYGPGVFGSCMRIYVNASVVYKPKRKSSRHIHVPDNVAAFVYAKLHWAACASQHEIFDF